MEIKSGYFIKCHDKPKYEWEESKEVYFLAVEEEIYERETSFREIKYNLVNLSIGAIVWCYNLAPSTLNELQERLEEYFVIDEVKEWNWNEYRSLY